MNTVFTSFHQKNVKNLGMSKELTAGELLKLAIERAGFDLVTAASMSGLVRPTLSTWTNGRAPFQPHKKLAHRDALDKLKLKLGFSAEEYNSILAASQRDYSALNVAEFKTKYQPADTSTAPILLRAIADPKTPSEDKEAAMRAILLMLNFER